MVNYGGDSDEEAYGKMDQALKNIIDSYESK